MPRVTIEELAIEREAVRDRVALREGAFAAHEPVPRRTAQASRRLELMTCCGTGCVAGGAFKLKEALEKEIQKHGLRGEVSVVPTGCNGFCGQGPLLVVMPEGIFYGNLKTENIPTLVEEHFVKGNPVKKFMFVSPETKEVIPHLSDIPFFKKQRNHRSREDRRLHRERWIRGAAESPDHTHSIRCNRRNHALGAARQGRGRVSDRHKVESLPE